MDQMNPTFWYQSPSARRNVPCLFLDRDGVVVEEVNYLGDPDKVKVLPGVRETLVRARESGWALGLVTNQAGVGRGYYGWDDFAAVQERILQVLDMGDAFDFVAACGAHPEAHHPQLRSQHPWRKPNPGMLETACQALGLLMRTSVMVGDQLSDLKAGLAAGVGHLVHVRTGHGAEARADVQIMADSLPVGRLSLVEGLGDLADVVALSPVLASSS